VLADRSTLRPQQQSARTALVCESATLCCASCALIAAALLRQCRASTLWKTLCGFFIGACTHAYQCASAGAELLYRSHVVAGNVWYCSAPLCRGRHGNTKPGAGKAGAGKAIPSQEATVQHGCKPRTCALHKQDRTATVAARCRLDQEVRKKAQYLIVWVWVVTHRERCGGRVLRGAGARLGRVSRRRRVALLGALARLVACSYATNLRSASATSGSEQQGPAGLCRALQGAAAAGAIERTAEVHRARQATTLPPPPSYWHTEGIRVERNERHAAHRARCSRGRGRRPSPAAIRGPGERWRWRGPTRGPTTCRAARGRPARVPEQSIVTVQARSGCALDDLPLDACS
jgi:hypothetical protein